MSTEIRERGASWLVRLLAALVCAGAVVGGAGAAGAAESAGKTIATAAKPARAAAERTSQLAQDRVRGAAALQDSVSTTRWLARGAALVAFVASVLGLSWLSAYWLRRRMLQWLALIALPSLVALALFASSTSGVEQKLRYLPRDWLPGAERDPQLGATQERRDSFAHALALHDASETSLLAALALRPTLEIAGGALVLTLLLWQLTNRRVLEST